MIFYFTGTGNSLWVAKSTATASQDYTGYSRRLAHQRICKRLDAISQIPHYLPFIL